MSMKVGGQAVIEGVMMKSDKAWSVAVRNSSGVIQTMFQSISPLPKFFQLPIIRGFITLIQSLVIGMKALNFSAVNVYEEEETMGSMAIAGTIAVSFLAGIALFILVPLYLTRLAGHYTSAITDNSLIFNLVDGLIRIFIFLIYIFIVGLWKEMARVFAYHGAEHKVIYAYEAGKEITLENVRGFSTQHPRCGTSFIFIVMILSILTFSFIPKHWDFLLKFLSRIVLIPLIAGVSYEVLKLSAKMQNNPIIRFLIKPGLMLQLLTTRPPDESQMEVAMTALKMVITEEKDVS